MRLTKIYHPQNILDVAVSKFHTVLAFRSGGGLSVQVYGLNAGQLGLRKHEGVLIGEPKIARVERQERRLRIHFWRVISV